MTSSKMFVSDAQCARLIENMRDTLTDDVISVYQCRGIVESLKYMLTKESTQDYRLKIAIVNFNFVAKTKAFTLANECTLRDFNFDTEQTYHIRTGYKTQDHLLANNYMTQVNLNRELFHKIPIGHGTQWFFEFSEHMKSFVKEFDFILVKGSDQIAQLDKLCGYYNQNFYDLADFGCPNIDTLIKTHNTVRQKSCVFHADSFSYCTASKCQMLDRWLCDNYLSVTTALKKKRNADILKQLI